MHQKAPNPTPKGNTGDRNAVSLRPTLHTEAPRTPPKSRRQTQCLFLLPWNAAAKQHLCYPTPVQHQSHWGKCKGSPILQLLKNGPSGVILTQHLSSLLVLSPTHTHLPVAKILLWHDGAVSHCLLNRNGKNTQCCSQNLLILTYSSYLQLTSYNQEPFLPSKVFLLEWVCVSVLSGDFNHMDDPNNLQAYQQGMNC